MKKRSILLIAMLLSLASVINAQDLWGIMQNSNFNYYEKKTEAESFLDNAKRTGDSIDSSMLKRYDRWQMFWDSRVDENGEASLYINNLKSYYQNNTTSSEETVWESIGPNTVFSGGSSSAEVMYTGQVSALEVVIKGNDTIIYAGSKSAGLWKSSNGGITYKNVTPNFIGGIRRISVHPLHKDTLIIATGLLRGETMMQQGEYGTGLYRSYNGGETWDNVLPVEISDNTLFVEVQYNIQNPDVIFAASFHNFYQSNNGGDSWTEYPLNLGEPTIRKLQHNPINSSQLMLGGYDMLYKRKPDGTFESILNTMLPFIPDETEDNMRIRTEVSIHGNTFYLLLYVQDNDTGSRIRRFLKSDNYGLSWDELYDGYISAVMYVATLEMSPDGRFFGGGVSFYRSDYNFTVFEGRQTGLHVDIRDICFPDPTNSNLVYVATDGGIGKSVNAAENWENISGNLALNEIYTFSIAESKPNLMIFGSADCGTTKRDYTGDWFNVYGGDGGATLISSYYPDNMLQRGSYPLKYSHSGGGDVSQWHSTGLSGTGGWYDQPIIEDPEYSNIFYAVCGNQITKSVDGGVTFDQANPWVVRGKMVTAMDFSKTNPNVFYFSSIEWSDADTKITFTKDKGLTWESFNIGALAGQNGNPLKITDIKVSDLNCDLAWVTIGNMHDGKKVYQTIDGGYSWTNITHNLDNLPVNGIEYDCERDILFLGNDAGIFYLANAQIINSDQTWEVFGNFPKFIATDLKVNYSTNELFASTFGSGMWKVDLSCVNIGGTRQISGIELWSSTKTIVQDVEIMQGATLTITGETKMASEAKITVHPGAKLIIDGGTLTNKCGGLWQGIVVLGNRDLPQNETNQGVVEIKNGSVIENASCAVYAGNPDVPWDNNSGGIVKVKGATFRNNKDGIAMTSYRTSENQSYIINSTFETTDFLYSLGKVPNTFISLWQVRQIEIKGNLFRNTRELDQFNDGLQGKGIMSWDADFNLDYYCASKYISPCPERDRIKNRFENLYVGVDIQNSGTITNNMIRNNEFYNNFTSISVNSADNVEITSNDFDIFSAVNFGGSSGLYIINSKGFHIEDNDFYAHSGNLPLGLFIRDCQGINEIYRNRFTGLYTGIHAEGKNKAFFSIPPNFKGLQIICNEFDDTYNDIYVAPSSIIATNQGSQDVSAYNSFSPECSGGINEFNNRSDYQINYFGERSPEYIPSCNNNINLFTGGLNTCPSKLGGNIIDADTRTACFKRQYKCY